MHTIKHWIQQAINKAADPYFGLPSSPKNLKLLEHAIRRELSSFMLIGDIHFKHQNGVTDVQIMDYDDANIPLIEFQFGGNNSIRFYNKN